MSNLLHKYRPCRLEEVIGNRKQIETVSKYIKFYRKGEPIFIHGPSGTGKNLVIELIAAEMGYEIVELTASDFRDYANVRRTVFEASQQRSLLNRGKIILIDDLDRIDNGMLRGLRDIIRMSTFPVVLMAMDPYSRQISEIRRASKMVRFEKVRHDSIRALLSRITDKEGLECEEKALSQLARMADGDVRAAIIGLESLGMATEERLTGLETKACTQSVFETLKVIFKTTHLENSRLALGQSDKSTEEIFWWLEENIFREYSIPEDIAKAYYFLAYADYFRSMIIRRQSWSLLKYFSDMTISVSIAKSEPYRKFVMYQSPRFFSMARRANSQELSQVLEKLSKSTHTSRKRAMEYLPVLKKLSRKKDFAERFGVNQEECELLRKF